jgi:hypothetical protein
MSKQSSGTLAKTSAGVMLTVCGVAAGIYFTDWSSKHPHVLAIVMVSSLVLAMALGAVGMMITNADAKPVDLTEPAPLISNSGKIYGSQVAGNSGSVHIGDVNHVAPAPQILRDYRAEWLSLADKMRNDCNGYRADWDHNNLLGETWAIKGGQNRNMCMAWSRQAGSMLLASPRVRANLPESVLNDPDDMSRWLRYLKERYIFEWRSTLEGTTDEGETERIQLGCVPNLGEQSAKACVDCSTNETQLSGA